MTTTTTRITKKAWEAFRSVRREYMTFTTAERALRFVLNPATLMAIEKEFWEQQAQRGLGGGHEGFWVEKVDTTRDAVQIDNRIFGIKVMTDSAVPEDEVELRAVLSKSWEAV